MRIPGKKGNDEGLLSIDFIIGFTIFMVALIFVGLMISGLLVHLQSRTIDYDAVAYRTSVILVEDPGWARIYNQTSTNWELNDLSNQEEKNNVLRLGLSIGKNYERILNSHKIDQFFNGSFTTEEYRSKLIFGDYPYRFSISLREIDPIANPLTVGDPVPPNIPTGYIKRVVKIKKMVSGPGPYAEFRPDIGTTILANTTGGNKSYMTVDLILPDFYQRELPYRVDPLREGMQITVQNFTGTQTLDFIQWRFSDNTGRNASTTFTAADYGSTVEVFRDGVPDTPPTGQILNNVTVVIRPQYFSDYEFLDEYDRMQTTLNFNENVTTQTIWAYNYSTIPQVPPLDAAVLEVRIW